MIQAALLGCATAIAGTDFRQHGAHATTGVLVLALFGTQLLLSALLWHLIPGRRSEQALAAELAQQLGVALRRAEDLIECSTDLVWEIDTEGRFTFVSDHNSIMGPDWGIKVGMLVSELGERDPTTTAQAWAEQLASNARGEVFRDFHYSLRRSNGAVSHFCVNGIPVRSGSGDLLGFRGTTRDRTREVETLQLLRHHSSHDALTGLPNRRAVMLVLDEMLVEARPDAGSIAVLLCDVDHFKDINDHHGHLVGDRVLAQFGIRLADAIAAGETAGRYGGEEFIVILHGDAVEAMRRAEEIRAAATAEPYPLSGTRHKLTASFGLALLRPTDTAATLIARADLALYHVKQTGRDRIELERDETAAAREAELKRDLHAAPALGEFELYFQPVMDTTRGTVTSSEALLRWNSPSRGQIGPAEFIPFAERNGLMADIDTWVLRAACTQAAGWDSSVRVSVNLSSSHLYRQGLVELISGILAQTGLAPARLELEVTETAMIADISAAADVLRRLQRLGVSIALDDLGTGYSSLSFLRTLPFDRIKIDRSFVCDLGIKPEAAAIIGGVIHLCTGMGVSVTAEGVETPMQIELLGAIGCREMQGYGVALPVPGDRIGACIGALNRQPSTLSFNRRSTGRELGSPPIGDHRTVSIVQDPARSRHGRLAAHS